MASHSDGSWGSAISDNALHLRQTCPGSSSSEFDPGYIFVDSSATFAGIRLPSLAASRVSYIQDRQDGTKRSAQVKV